MLIGADADGGFNGHDENFPIANLSSVRAFGDDFDSGFDLRVRQNDLQLDLGQEVHGVFAAAINFRVTFLATKPLYFRDGHAGDADFV